MAVSEVKNVSFQGRMVVTGEGKKVREFFERVCDADMFDAIHLGKTKKGEDKLLLLTGKDWWKAHCDSYKFPLTKDGFRKYIKFLNNEAKEKGAKFFKFDDFKNIIANKKINLDSLEIAK